MASVATIFNTILLSLSQNSSLINTSHANALTGTIQVQNQLGVTCLTTNTEISKLYTCAAITTKGASNSTNNSSNTTITTALVFKETFPSNKFSTKVSIVLFLLFLLRMGQFAIILSNNLSMYKLTWTRQFANETRLQSCALKSGRVGEGFAW